MEVVIVKTRTLVLSIKSVCCYSNIAGAGEDVEEATIALTLSYPCNKSFCQNDTFRDCVVLDNHQDLATVRAT